MIPITYELAKERMAHRLPEANLRLPLSTGYRSAPTEVAVRR
jgi:hypothetical protein